MIHKADQNSLTVLNDIAHQMGADKSTDYFETILHKQDLGSLDIYLAGEKGYVILNYQPKYGLYKRLNIPEIQDLNVIPSARRAGLGRAMVEYCEEMALDKGFDQIGISFGLHGGFGAAQRLYIDMGYMPDGQGVTYDRRVVQAGERCQIDDDLCLMLIKELR